MSHYRNLNIEGEPWQIKIGRSGVEIKNPRGHRAYVSMQKMMFQGWERGEDGAVTPGIVRRYIDITYRGVSVAEADKRERESARKSAIQRRSHCTENPDGKEHCSCYGYEDCCWCDAVPPPEDFIGKA